jgi:hypothetical protein
MFGKIFVKKLNFRANEFRKEQNHTAHTASPRTRFAAGDGDFTGCQFWTKHARQTIEQAGFHERAGQNRSG